MKKLVFTLLLFYSVNSYSQAPSGDDIRNSAISQRSEDRSSIQTYKEKLINLRKGKQVEETDKSVQPMPILNEEQLEEIKRSEKQEN